MKIFFIGPLVSSFVKNDIKILEKNHTLTFENAAFGRGLKGGINLLLLSLRSIYKTLSSDAVFCWFADYTTFLPSLLGKLLGKKVYVVAGGFDVFNMPEINCGAYLRPARWFCVRNTFKNATKIFAVSNFVVEKLDELTNGEHSPTKVIYNCVDAEKFSGTDFSAERDIFLTVSQGDSQTDYLIKGIDVFIKLAKSQQNHKFVLAGLRGTALDLAYRDAKGVSNIEIIPGPLSLYDDIIPLYRRSIAYCQLSMAESFGVAVLESMLCGAVPIITNAGALPEITSGSGRLIAHSFDNLAELLQKSQHYSKEERESLNEFAKKYNINRREQEINLEM